MNLNGSVNLAFLLVGAIIGALVAFPAGMGIARTQRAWRDRRNAKKLAATARKNAYLTIPRIAKGIMFAIVAVVVLIITLTSGDKTEPAGDTPSSPPASSPSR